jgi:hypothetical protein
MHFGLMVHVERQLFQIVQGSSMLQLGLMGVGMGVAVLCCRTPRNRGGLGYMQIPIVADTTKVGPHQQATG